ncbi:MAG: aminopeptidase [Clostridia bacterium]|nr:aminopeptidase [Clostridia bacterium]
MSESKFEKLEKELLLDRRNGFEKTEHKENEAAFKFSEDYKKFLSECKTERECAFYFEEEAKKNGFKELGEYKTLLPGDKFYIKNTEKAILIGVLGEKAISEGVCCIAAHIDSPRLDLKPNPLYEDSDIAYFKTHYYGGIKKFQWLTIPLAIHGVIVKKDGEKVRITIGEDENDPVFCISDILPHLGNAQMSGEARKIIPGEKLNVIIGSVPVDDEKVSKKVKLNVMMLLNEKYGITEKDFVSADIEVVPAYKARDIGIDRSLVGSYGHDDRVCAYTAFKAILEANAPQKTAICYLVDKEETGSSDSTGMQSAFFGNIVALLAKMTDENYDDVTARKALMNSECLSADVTAAYDPNFAEVFEANNSTYLNGGVALMKYSGARGKSGTSEAQAEFVEKITSKLTKNGVIWQVGELGKVDEGGGGTVAQFFAILGMNVIDCGVPLLSMHSPFEIASKFDIYMAYKAYLTFLR